MCHSIAQDALKVGYISKYPLTMTTALDIVDTQAWRKHKGTPE